LFSRRYAPATCVTLNSGSSLLYENETLRDSKSTQRITRDGKFKPVRAA
jgi:hypothetical protein